MLAAALLALTLQSAPTPYLPRVLFPGTYGNFCGPTPEHVWAESKHPNTKVCNTKNIVSRGKTSRKNRFSVEGGCAPHGRRGDAPIDVVDAACAAHDAALASRAADVISYFISALTCLEEEENLSCCCRYCACDVSLRSRSGAPSSGPSSPVAISSLTAVRGVLGEGLMRAGGGDDAFAQCSHEADVALIREGVQLRARAQRTGCDDGAPAWLCARSGATKERFAPKQTNKNLWASRAF